MTPKWFRDWAKAFGKESDARWAKQEEFNKEVKEFMKYVGDFIKQQVEFNKQQTEFNKHVLDVFQRNNLK